MCEGRMENAGSLSGVEMDRQTGLTLDLDGRKGITFDSRVVWY